MFKVMVKSISPFCTSRHRVILPIATLDSVAFGSSSGLSPRIKLKTKSPLHLCSCAAAYVIVPVSAMRKAASIQVNGSQE